MDKNEARKLIATLTREDKIKLIRMLAQMPSLKDKVAVIEEKYGIKIANG